MAHGGFTTDDTHIACLISVNGANQTEVTQTVYHTQVSPCDVQECFMAAFPCVHGLHRCPDPDAASCSNTCCALACQMIGLKLEN